jgi:hypothetical protein
MSKRALFITLQVNLADVIYGEVTKLNLAKLN